MNFYIDPSSLSRRVALLAMTAGLLIPGLSEGATITLVASGPDTGGASSLVVSGGTVYFAANVPGGRSINSVSTSGGPVTNLYGVLPSPNAITIIGNTLYWIDANSGPVTDTQILTAPAAGGGPVTAIYTGAISQPIVDGSGIATDGTKLYTADEVQGRVHSLNLDGSGLVQLGPNRYSGFFDTEHQNSIATAGGILYVLDAGRAGVDSPQLVTIPAGGAASFTPLWTGSPFVAPVAIAIGDGQIFIGDGTTIYTMPVAGGAPSVFFSGGPLMNIGISGLSYDNGVLYVADQGSSAIYRIDASVPEPSSVLLLSTGMAGLVFIVRRRRQKI